MVKRLVALLSLGIIFCTNSVTTFAYPIGLSETETAEINYGILADTNNEVVMSYHDLMVNTLNHLPKGVVQYLDEQDWNLFLTDENINYYFNDENTYLGATHFYEKWIKITTNPFGFTTLKYDTDEEKAFKICLTHEIGHAIDAKNGGDFRFSETDPFMQVYNQESKVFSENISNGAYNHVEYFAEAFKYFLLRPETLQQCCPLTYGYMFALLENEFPYTEGCVKPNIENVNALDQPELTNAETDFLQENEDSYVDANITSIESEEITLESEIALTNYESPSPVAESIVRE